MSAKKAALENIISDLKGRLETVERREAEKKAIEERRRNEEVCRF